MLRQFLMWALICSTSPLVCSQNQTTPTSTGCDSIEYSISTRLLEEIVVTASPVINKNDRKIIRPDREMSRTSADGIDLLRRLQLPRITVNPMTNTISVSGGGNVILCINGVESTESQIAAIRPQDIEKIEYHDNPGLRYAGAAVVIDYITCRHDTGGNLSFDSFGAYAKGRWATIDHISGQYNNGRSVWSTNAGYMGQHKDQWLRDYDEVWRYPDSELTRQEVGLPVSVGQSGLESSINYNYQHPSGNLLNVRVGLDINDVPDKEEGDRRAILQTSDMENPLLVTEHTEEHSISPNIGLYYTHRLPGNGGLMFDAQYSYMRSRMLHTYSEDNYTESNHVKGDKHTLKFLGMYENRSGSRVWSVGVSGYKSTINNIYHQAIPIKIHIDRSEAALAGEYSDRFGNWGVTGNVMAAYRHMGQYEKNIDKLFLLPSASISYRPSDKWFIRYAASLDYNMPSAAEISDITQQIQAGMVRQGNPELHPFRITTQSANVSFDTELLSAYAWVEHRYEHKPIMESVIFDNGVFVRTYFNQRSFQRLTIGGSVSVRPWKKHLTLTAKPQLTRYFSRGIDYHHCHNILRIGLSVDFSYGNWLAYANIFSGPANYMYGEEIIEEKDMNQIMAGYTRDKWSLHIGVFNAFLKNYWMETRNLSALAPYTSKAHSARSSSYFAVKFSLSLDFGKGIRHIDMREQRTDNDSGILTGTK